ncbi:MAG: hypothetical protein JWM68_2735 [Verrucomicrobiales bacterium]|nr:hypothetical protein [Verrucomicrobiales bacterium]
MKNHLFSIVSFIAFALFTSSAPAKDFDDAHRFVFYAVLEGSYEDGLSTEDVSQILLKEEKDKYHYAHFVYACPLCTPTIHALEAYQSRPKQFYGMKKQGSTFGSGLSAELKQQLYSAKPEDRLAAINTLIQGWVAKRISLLRLTDQERTQLQTSLEKLRKIGMDRLKGNLNDLKTGGSAHYPVSAFTTIQQCAVCNGACGLKLKPDSGK